MLIIQGSLPWAGVVKGIDGVRETLVRVFLADLERAQIKGFATAVASLEKPEAWEAHGSGDG